MDSETFTGSIIATIGFHYLKILDQRTDYTLAAITACGEGTSKVDTLDNAVRIIKAAIDMFLLHRGLAETLEIQV